MFAVIRLGHQGFHVLSNHLGRRVAKNAFRRRIEGFNDPFGVNGDDSFDDGIQNRAEPSLFGL